MGQIAARCAAELGPSGQVHNLFGPETMSFPDAIRRWARARDESVKFRSMPLPAFRVLTAAAAPVRPLFPVIYSLIRSFNKLDWSGDAAESRRLAGGELLSVEDAARRPTLLCLAEPSGRPSKAGPGHPMDPGLPWWARVGMQQAVSLCSPD